MPSGHIVDTIKQYRRLQTWKGLKGVPSTLLCIDEQLRSSKIVLELKGTVHLRTGAVEEI